MFDCPDDISTVAVAIRKELEQEERLWGVGSAAVPKGSCPHCGETVYAHELRIGKQFYRVKKCHCPDLGIQRLTGA